MQPILILAFVLCNVFAYGQNSADTVYLITKSITVPGQTGVRRTESKKASQLLYKYSPIHFSMRTEDKRVEVRFGHYGYNFNELSKIRSVGPRDSMKMEEKPRAFLNTIQPIDLDQMIATRPKEEIWDWALSIKQGQVVYIIDRNDFTPTSITLVEVKVSSNAPNKINVTY